MIANKFDPVVWSGGKEPAVHKKFIAALEKFTHQKYASGLSVQGYIAIYALADGIRKAGSTQWHAVSKAMAGMTFDTPVGRRTFSINSHETFSPEFYGVMVKDAAYPFAVMQNPELLPPQATN